MPRLPVVPAFLLAFALAAAGCSTTRPDPTPAGMPLLDGESGDRSVVLTWSTRFGPPVDWGPTIDPPRKVLLQVSDEGPESGYRLLAERPGGSDDSLVVDGLVNGRTYHFRAILVGGSFSVLEPTAPIAVMAGVVERIAATHPIDSWEWTELAWSPDSREIAFVRAMGGLPELRVLDLATGIDRPVLSGPGFVTISDPAWSPDGSRIAFSSGPTRTAGDIDYRIWTVGRDGAGVHSWSPGRVDFGPAWANSDSTLVFCRGSHDAPNIAELFLLEAGGGGTITPLTRDATLHKRFPDVRRTDGRIVFEGQSTREYRAGLYVLAGAGGAIEPLLASQWWEERTPSWSPDGGRVVFGSNRAGHPDLWVLEVATGAMRQLTTGRRGRVLEPYPRWSPDGTRIAVARQAVDGTRRIVVLHAP